MSTENSFKNNFIKSGTVFSELFGISRLWSFIASAFILAVLLAAAWWFTFSSPARHITLATGPEGTLAHNKTDGSQIRNLDGTLAHNLDGSTFANTAEKYRPIVEGPDKKNRTGVKLTTLATRGSQENLEKLLDPAVKVDAGFILSKVEPMRPPQPAPQAQSDAKTDAAAPAQPPAKPQAKLVSLGCVAYQPIFVFYRADAPVRLLSDFAGKHLSIGAPGGGTHTVATALLDANNLNAKTATITTEPSADAAKELLAGKTDVVFLMGESAPTDTLRKLLREPGVKLFSFEQADAYTRKLTGLSKLKMPQGGIDLAKNIPDRDVWLIGPAVHLVARESFDNALVCLLLDAAKEVHGKPSLLQNKGEFPAPIEGDFKIDDAAENYYKNGKGLLYRHLPFWLATIAYQFGTVILPTILILVSGLRGLYAVYKFSVQFRINRWYRILLKIERERFAGMTPQKKAALLAQVADVEKNLHKMKVPAGFVSQFYGLRQHIGYVASILEQNPAGLRAESAA